MAREIRGKNILITGASSGIGRATALELARRGANLGLAARREELLRSLAAELKSLGGRCFYTTADVADRAQFGGFVEQGVREFGRIDVLVNNAGYGLRATVEETTTEDYLALLQVNLLGTFYGVQSVLPHMKRQRSGHIINITSVAGTRAMPQSGAYSSTKFAVNGLTEALRVELKGFGIDVSVVLPISTTTEFFEVAGRKTGKAARPVGPVQTPETVAKVIVSCIRRPRPEVMTHPLSRTLHILNAWMPGVIDWYAGKFLTMK